ncbi:MAG: carboxypeptidase regulatory-like domain-containing protein, partial [Limisphaerales bacterium]
SGNVIGGTNGAPGQGVFPGRAGSIGFAGGGNIANQGSLIIESSIIDASVNGGNIYGAVTDAGYNISSDSTGLGHQTSLKNTDPKLGLFGDNGGNTYTLPLLADSPAIDRANPYSALATDQRGTARQYGDSADAGAYELPVTKIRGRVTDGAVGIDSVRITAGTRTTVTDSNGFYVISNLTTGTYIVTAEANGFFIVPESQTVNLGARSATNVDFIATRLWNLGGRITENGQGLPAVAVSANGNQTTTDANGYFLFTNLTSGTYTITTSKYGYSFIPPITNILLQQNLTNINFEAKQTIFTLSGRILEGTTSVANVRIRVGNQITYTDSNGIFSMSNLTAGNYVIIPEKDGYEFIPQVLSINLNSSTNITFNAQGIYSIYGKILRNGQPLKGVLVYAGGYTGITDDSGDYTINNVSPKIYKVYPILSGYNFDPPYYEINVNRDYYGLDYVGLNSYLVTCRIIKINPINGETNGVFTNKSIIISATNYYLSLSGQTNSYYIQQTITNSVFTLTNISEGMLTIALSNEYIKFIPDKTNISITSQPSEIAFLGSELYDVKGNVFFNGVGLAGVLINASGLTALTDAQGTYILSKLESTNIVVRPQLDGYRFEPTEITIQPSGTTTNVNFVASGNLSIRGTVTKRDGGLAGVDIVVNQRLITSDSKGEYSIGDLPPGSYLITPYLSRHIFIPSFTNIVLSNVDEVVNFVAVQTYNVSGRVTTDGINGIGGVVVSSGNSTAITDQYGYYTLSSIPEGTNRITATLENYSFLPIDILITSNTNGINIIATRLHTISGRILEGSRGISGVVVTAGGVSAFSTIGGYYILTNVPEGTVIVSAARDGYRFAPNNIQINLISDITNLNFQAYGVLSVSGRITSDGTNGIANVRVTAYGFEVLTDSNGYYVISNLPPRSITVIPVSDNYLFMPASVNITLVDKDATNINFIATRFSLLSGTVTEYGQPKVNVKIVCSDGQEILTDTNGQFSISTSSSGSYTITPTLGGHQFEPISYTVNLPSDATNLNFISYPLTMSAIITNNVLFINVRAKPLGNYMLEFSESLSPAVWNTIVPFQTDTNGLIQLIIPTIDKVKPRFYRFRNI